MGQRPSANGQQPQRKTVGAYLIERLYELGLRHVFGIPGDYVLGFYTLLEQSEIECVGTTREDCAGFAADAYARINGLGAVCVTYCVGGLNITNAIAGAYAEKSPVVAISGAPGVSERVANPLLHHKVRDFSTQREVFSKITVASAVLDDRLTAFREIDRVLQAVQRYKRPGYLELPRDCLDLTPQYDHAPRADAPASDRAALNEALAEAREMIASSRDPVILAGVEIHRFGLQSLLLGLAESARIPIATTLLGKSVIRETHPLCLGVYEGAMGRDETRDAVEDADCVIMLGAFMSDINLGIYTAQLDQSYCIDATSEHLRIRHHHYRDVVFEDFLKGLITTGIMDAERNEPSVRQQAIAPFHPAPAAAITIHRLFARLDAFLDDDMVVIADIGDALFGAVDLHIHRQTEFLSPAYYTSMGFAVPAALGVQCANSRLRPLVIVGDGAFQMTGMELCNALRRGQNPIVLVLDNGGYGTERLIQKGAFNDIAPWHYHKLAEVFGGGEGYDIYTEGDLDEALQQAQAETNTFSLLNIHLDQADRSPALVRLGNRLAEKA